mmetsp:Transcript_37949/g.84985  ORF Transcript_37949/g.84985 Transcript_37949/m.84985 type:complete len:276 (+) Transcript_37949:1178-2005(+)
MITGVFRGGRSQRGRQNPLWVRHSKYTTRCDAARCQNIVKRCPHLHMGPPSPRCVSWLFSLHSLVARFQPTLLKNGYGYWRLPSPIQAVKITTWSVEITTQQHVVRWKQTRTQCLSLSASSLLGYLIQACLQVRADRTDWYSIEQKKLLESHMHGTRQRHHDWRSTLHDPVESPEQCDTVTSTSFLFGENACVPMRSQSLQDLLSMMDSLGVQIHLLQRYQIWCVLQYQIQQQWPPPGPDQIPVQAPKTTTAFGRRWTPRSTFSEIAGQPRVVLH